MLLCCPVSAYVRVLSWTPRGTIPTTRPLNVKRICAIRNRYKSSCRSSGATRVNLSTLIYKGTPVSNQLVTPPGFQVNHIPNRNLVSYPSRKIQEDSGGVQMFLPHYAC